MKLVIDLPDEVVKWFKRKGFIPIGQYLAVDEAMKKAKPLSEVLDKGEWIPVSERLPEEREWYLAVFKEKDTDFQLIPRVADYIGHGENKWRWIDEEGLPQEYFDLLECVAWQPLPEPYKAESEVKPNE